MPIYKSTDYEQVISRIKSKVMTLGIKMGDVLSEEEIVSFEEQHCVHLPQAYRMFLKKVGNGCNMMDGFQLHSLSDIKAQDLSQPFMLEDVWIWEDDDAAWADLVKIMEAKLKGQFELIDIGDGMSYNLIVTGQCQGEVWNFADVGVQPCCERQDFLGWFELWLDMQDDVDYFKDYKDA